MSFQNVVVAIYTSTSRWMYAEIWLVIYFLHLLNVSVTLFYSVYFPCIYIFSIKIWKLRQDRLMNLSLKKCLYNNNKKIDSSHSYELWFATCYCWSGSGGIWGIKGRDMLILGPFDWTTWQVNLCFPWSGNMDFLM